MAKSKLGLQKEVSKIFTGIQLPKKNTAGQDTRTSAPVPPVTPPVQVVPPVTVTPAVTESAPASVTPSTPVTTAVQAEVITPPATAPVVKSSASAVPAPVVTPGKNIIPKPAVVSPKPFTIPEPPPKTESQQPRQAVYEPPKPRQTLSIAPETTSAPAKQSKPEVIIKQPRNSPVLKIVEKIKAKLFNSAKGPGSGRQKAMILLSPILVIVLLFVVVNAVKKSPKTSAKTSKKANAANAAVAFDGKINWELPQTIPATLRDPMVFVTVSNPGKETTEGPVVKGIVYSEDNPCAVVGDRIVSVGDTVAGATVVKINPDSVDFAIGDKKWTQKVER